MRVVKERDGGVVRRVRLVDGDGEQVTAACRFLDHLVDRGFSPHTICAYAYDLRRLFTFLAAEGMCWREFRGPDALRLLAFLRRAPSRRPAQRLGLTVVVVAPELRGSGAVDALCTRLREITAERGWSVLRWITMDDSYRARQVRPRGAADEVDHLRHGALGVVESGAPAVRAPLLLFSDAHLACQSHRQGTEDAHFGIVVGGAGAKDAVRTRRVQHRYIACAGPGVVAREGFEAGGRHHGPPRRS